MDILGFTCLMNLYFFQINQDALTVLDLD